MELLIYYQHYFKVKKVKHFVIKFIDYDIIWQDQLVLGKRRNEERSIKTWDEMKLVMRKIFVHGNYYKELY